MQRLIFKLPVLLLLFLASSGLRSQSTLSLEEIMKGNCFMGVSPENLRWSADSKQLFFNWTQNPDSALSLFAIRPPSGTPVRLSLEERKDLMPAGGDYNRERTKLAATVNGDIFLYDLKTGEKRQITFTSAIESDPYFSFDERKIIFLSGGNLFAWNISDGTLRQLADFRSGQGEVPSPKIPGENDKMLNESQLFLFSTLASAKEKRELEVKENKILEPEKPAIIYTGQESARSVSISPNEQFVVWQSFKRQESNRTIIPEYVTESGYTTTMTSRTKVGTSDYQQGILKITDLKRDTTYELKTNEIPDIYVKQTSASKTSEKKEKPEKRKISVNYPVWSDDGKSAVVDIYSDDNKDRWIMLLDINTGGLRHLDRQHDSAWIGGPGIRYNRIGWLGDNKTIYFQSEETGYSHLYYVDVTTGIKRAITSGKYEINDLRLSADKKRWYFVSNETDPGIRDLYTVPVSGGPSVRLTDSKGGVEYSLSPDEKFIALRISDSRTPWELYMLENRKNGSLVKLTESQSEEFRSYKWRVPEFIKFKASDGIEVPARLYKPETKVKNGAAVIFVHGAGYLQNAHRWWSSYEREYMFHNFLADNGYTVLDIDYRGSAGYGRDWRTAIYRYMGGRDLEDNVDGAAWLVKEHGIYPDKIGLYGGSYGGFITLMAMFTKPDVFRAGAALRPVTDWAHYNHGYTSNILNTPAADSIAYAKSSPIYYAGGLKGKLLICHGMIDDNVHFQDVVRLSQRLIELGKENWELAVYPLERHSFTETSSWVDEYRRIFRLFEEALK